MYILYSYRTPCAERLEPIIILLFIASYDSAVALPWPGREPSVFGSTRARLLIPIPFLSARDRKCWRLHMLASKLYHAVLSSVEFPTPFLHLHVKLAADTLMMNSGVFGSSRDPFVREI